MRYLNRLLLVITFLFSVQLVIAQKAEKPTLLVYGSELEAFSVAMQSAKSSVPTVWVIDKSDGFSSMLGAALYHKGNLNVAENPLYGGLWRDFVSKIAIDTLDSLSYSVDLSKSSAVLEQMARAQPNLTIVQGKSIDNFEKRKNGWEVVLTDKSKYDVRVLVDGSQDSRLRFKVPELQPILRDSLKSVNELRESDIRTVVALAREKVLLVSDVIKSQHDNFFSLDLSRDYTADFINVPIRMNIGQTIGAAAAYCAFFKTSADKIDVRKLQIELLNYGARLASWQDIASDDPNIAILQKMYLTSIMAVGDYSNSLNFNKSEKVQLEAIKSMFTQYYSRAQLWFLDNDAEYLNVRDAISLIKMIAFRSDEIDKEIQGRWKRAFRFDNEYDLDRPITRYEFAVLVGTYADPFTKAVTSDGKILR